MLLLGELIILLKQAVCDYLVRVVYLGSSMYFTSW